MAQAPVAFRTVRVVVLDEIDKLRVLPGEGDADSLASKRVSTYGTDFKILRFSKPTLEGQSRINRHFLRGSRAFYYVACPSCGEFQEPGWALLCFDDMSLRVEEYRHAVDALEGGDPSLIQVWENSRMGKAKDRVWRTL